ncbi:hypothetical protein [Streptomyces sp. SM12]|uniref:hypothetical protein n=1 Tax=Streptomyces sp. SM12 TaxID=1071602 RepID=UPI000CD55A39|nr:hypothetical protein [Streptomyces sp. SM12]
MSAIDPTAHRELIDLQAASDAAQRRLLAYRPEPGTSPADEDGVRRQLRVAASEAAEAKNTALDASGLASTAPGGRHQVNVDLRNAARARE